MLRWVGVVLCCVVLCCVVLCCVVLCCVVSCRVLFCCITCVHSIVYTCHVYCCTVLRLRLQLLYFVVLWYVSQWLWNYNVARLYNRRKLMFSLLLILNYTLQFDKNSQHCTKCHKKFAEFFCVTCKHLTGMDDNPYHCDKCGICRWELFVCEIKIEMGK